MSLTRSSRVVHPTGWQRAGVAAVTTVLAAVLAACGSSGGGTSTPGPGTGVARASTTATPHLGAAEDHLRCPRHDVVVEGDFHHAHHLYAFNNAGQATSLPKGMWIQNNQSGLWAIWVPTGTRQVGYQVGVNASVTGRTQAARLIGPGYIQHVVVVNTSTNRQINNGSATAQIFLCVPAAPPVNAHCNSHQLLISAHFTNGTFDISAYTPKTLMLTAAPSTVAPGIGLAVLPGNTGRVSLNHQVGTTTYVLRKSSDDPHPIIYPGGNLAQPYVWNAEEFPWFELCAPSPN